MPIGINTNMERKFLFLQSEKITVNESYNKDLYGSSADGAWNEQLFTKYDTYSC